MVEDSNNRVFVYNSSPRQLKKKVFEYWVVMKGDEREGNGCWIGNCDQVTQSPLARFLIQVYKHKYDSYSGQVHPDKAREIRVFEHWVKITDYYKKVVTTRWYRLPLWAQKFRLETLKIPHREIQRLPGESSIWVQTCNVGQALEFLERC